MHRWLLAFGLVSTATLTLGTITAGGASSSLPANFDVSQQRTSESEETIAVNPKDPRNVVIVTNIEGAAPGMFSAVKIGRAHV